jgi:hypothetical protein
MRIHERARSIHRADAVSIAVRREACVILAGDNGVLERRNVRLDRFGVRASKARIARAPNFIAGNSLALEKFRQQPCSGSVHRVEHEPEFRFSDALPVHEFFQCI